MLIISFSTNKCGYKLNMEDHYKRGKQLFSVDQYYFNSFGRGENFYEAHFSNKLDFNICNTVRF